MFNRFTTQNWLFRIIWRLWQKIRRCLLNHLSYNKMFFPFDYKPWMENKYGYRTTWSILSHTIWDIKTIFALCVFYALYLNMLMMLDESTNFIFIPLQKFVLLLKSRHTLQWVWQNHKLGLINLFELGTFISTSRLNHFTYYGHVLLT